MIRKFIIVAGALATLSAAALAPTSASAFGWHPHHFHGGWGRVGIAPVIVEPTECYIVKRVVDTPAGPRLRRVEVCD